MAIRSRLLVLLALVQVACGESPADMSTTQAGTTDMATSGTTEEEPMGGWAEVLAAGPELGMLMSVWGSAPDDIIVVGGQEHADGESTAAMLAFDGAQWQPVDLPPGAPWLNWVFGIDGEVWSVGRGGTVLRREGGAWTLVETPTQLELWGVWGDSATSLWVVGGEPIAGPPVMLRWDGEAFSEVATSFLPEDVRALFKVWGRSADEVVAVGDAGAVVVWNGEAWALRANESIAPLFAAWAAPGDPIVTVGGRANGRIAHVLETVVQGETSTLPGLNGVWVDASGDATVVGDLGTIARVPAGSLTPDPEESPTHHLLHATFGFDGGPRFAVGGSFHAAPPKVGVILRSAE
jgi:hypothetical protein